MAYTLQIIPHSVAICQFSPDTPVPADVLSQPFFSVTRTSEELSLVVPAGLELPGGLIEPGWRILKMNGPLYFGLTGIMADISGVLRAADVSIFTISTYDTDYVLVKEERLQMAVEALEQAGYTVTSEESI